MVSAENRSSVPLWFALMLLASPGCSDKKEPGADLSSAGIGTGTSQVSAAGQSGAGQGGALQAQAGQTGGSGHAGADLGASGQGNVAGSAGGLGTAGFNASAGAAGSSTAGVGGATSDCADVYPYSDGYTCEQQASWGKCNESWLRKYCNKSCNRCGSAGEGGQGGNFSGPRDAGVVLDGGEILPAVARTPPMGWSSWNKFGCDVTDALIREIADAMVSSGMKAAGYQYVNIDDCWQASARDASGNIVADAARFPKGIKAVADYVHGLGLKLGLYSDRGTETCGGLPGSFGFETKDAETYAAWGVDYLKYDNCNVPEGREQDPEMQEDYVIMRNALIKTGRPIVYSICAWWFQSWMPKVGHLWRTTTDIKDVWSGAHQSVTRILNWSGGDTGRYGSFAETNFTCGAYPPPGLAQYAGPGHWNDPDMLEVGNGGMTDIEYQSHFSLWALMAAPLIAGNDLRTMSEATKNILTNTDVIAVNQDPLGIQGTPISDSTTLEVWSKKLSGNDTNAVILFNRTEAAADIEVTWKSLGMTATQAAVRDLWARLDKGTIADKYSTKVPSHGVAMIKVVGK